MTKWIENPITGWNVAYIVTDENGDAVLMSEEGPLTEDDTPQFERVYFSKANANPGGYGYASYRRPHPAWIRQAKKLYRGDVEQAMVFILKVLRESDEEVDLQRALAIAKQVEDAAW